MALLPLQADLVQIAATASAAPKIGKVFQRLCRLCSTSVRTVGEDCPFQKARVVSGALPSRQQPKPEVYHDASATAADVRLHARVFRAAVLYLTMQMPLRMVSELVEVDPEHLHALRADAHRFAGG
jgi:hypothetical protein